MFVRSVEISGFMPYRDSFKLKFDRSQIVNVSGQYGDDPAKSNRAGKSSFIDAQVWCLYGKSRAKREVELIHDQAEFAEVICELYDPRTEQSTFVQRMRTKDNKGSLEIRGLEGEKKKVTQEAIDQLVGMTYEEFLFTAFFKQNDIDQFMEADPQKKKEILMKWLQTKNWSEFAEKVNSFKLGLAEDLMRVKSLIAGLPTENVDLDSLREEIGEIDKDKKKLLAEAEGLSKQRIDHGMALKELKAVDAKKEKAVEIEEHIRRLKTKRPDSDAHKENLRKLDEALEKYPLVGEAKHEEIVDKRDKFVSAIGQTNYEIEEVKKRIRDFGKSMTGVCPILQRACDRIEPDPDALSKLEQEKAGLEKKLERHEENRDKANKFVTLYQKQQQWLRQKEQITSQLQAGKQLESQIADLAKQRAEVLKSIPDNVEAKITELLGKIDMIKEDEGAIRDKLETHDRRLGEIRELIKQQTTKQNRLQALEVELQSIEQQLGDAQYVEYMFGKNGIPSMELENSYSEIEDDANLILKNLRAPFHIEFTATRELKEWEPNCLACGTPFERGEKTHICKSCKTERQKKQRDELSLTVYEGGQERQFYMDSGGGKILLSVGIRLALTQLARRRKGSQWGTIYLDELFGQLDQTNRKLMADLISSTLLQSLGFEQVFIISHDPSIQSSLANQVIVKRNQEKGYSELLM